MYGKKVLNIWLFQFFGSIASYFWIILYELIIIIIIWLKMNGYKGVLNITLTQWQKWMIEKCKSMHLHILIVILHYFTNHLIISKYA